MALENPLCIVCIRQIRPFTILRDVFAFEKTWIKIRHLAIDSLSG